MAQQPQNNQSSEDARGILKRVHQLGLATEQLFSRLYGVLTHREQQEKLSHIEEVAAKIERRNRLLRQMVQARDVEVERLHQILSHISEGIILQDDEGHIIDINPAARALIGNQSRFWESELGRLFDSKRKLETNGTELAPLGEAERIEVNNRVLSAQIAAITSSEGQRIGTLMILRDVTRDTLAERLQNSFINQISHELVTPLAPMRVASEILLNAPEDQSPNRRMLEMIGRNIDILDRMVTEMLDMSAMTSGDFRIRHEPLLIEDLIWDVVESYNDDVKDHDLDVSVMLRDTHALSIAGDAKHLRWALSNLLRNAIQYNEPGEHVFVTAGVNRQNQQAVFIEVIDSGVGISKEDMPHIFDLFYRGEPRTRNGKRLDPRGLGQGLFVARTIAHAHDGFLVAESEIGQGSKFHMSLPRGSARDLPA